MRNPVARGDLAKVKDRVTELSKSSLQTVALYTCAHTNKRGNVQNIVGSPQQAYVTTASCSRLHEKLSMHRVY